MNSNLTLFMKLQLMFTHLLCDKMTSHDLALNVVETS